VPRSVRICAHMRLPSPALALLLALVCAAGSASAQNSDKGGVVYRWVDEHGIVHYGDTVPPKYARDQRELLNSQGVVIGHVDAEKTPAQLAAEARAQAQRQAQKQRDYFLLSTYASVKDIESLRDERLSQLQAQQTAAQQYVQSLQSRLGSLESRAQAYKPYSSRPNAPRMPDELAQELVQTASEVRLQNQAIGARNQQEAQVRAQFQSDIERFEQLKAAPP
jgi:multidrug efflux pump subunit AcrA (membrane-fusion protein)